MFCKTHRNIKLEWKEADIVCLDCGLVLEGRITDECRRNFTIYDGNEKDIAQENSIPASDNVTPTAHGRSEDEGFPMKKGERPLLRRRNSFPQ